MLNPQQPHASQYSQLRGEANRTSCLLLPDGVEPAKVGRRPDLVDDTRHTWRMTRIPAAMAGLALVAVTAVACGSDDGDDSTAARPDRDVERPGVALRLGQPRRRRRPSTERPPNDERRPGALADHQQGGQGRHRRRLPGTGARRRAGRLDRPVRRRTRPRRGGMWSIDLTDPNGAEGHRWCSRPRRRTAWSAQHAPRRGKPGRDGRPQRLGTGKWTAYTGTDCRRRSPRSSPAPRRSWSARTRTRS